MSDALSPSITADDRAFSKGTQPKPLTPPPLPATLANADGQWCPHGRRFREV